MPPIGIAIIGCGHWGRNYVRLLQTMGLGPAVVCDLDPAKTAEVQRATPGRFDSATDFRRVVTRADIDAVIVATTAKYHFEVAAAALAAGKHVLVEKPLTLSSADGKELVRLQRQVNRTVMVAHTFLYNPAVRAMRNYVRQGEAGSIYYLHATRTHLGLVRPDVSAVWDLATHDISIFGYLLEQRPLTVSAVGGRYLAPEREDVAFISLSYPQGVMGNIQVSWVDSNKMRQVEIIGSRARIVFNDLDPMERLKIYQKGLSIDRPYQDFGEFQLLIRDGDIISPRTDTSEPLRLMTEHFIDCVENAKSPLTGLEDGLEVVTILEAIDRSLKGFGTPVQLDWSEFAP